MSINHDQRFKELLMEFIREFFMLFFPDWVERFDFSKCSWQNKETHTDLTDGSRRSMDLVVRLPTRFYQPGQSEDSSDWITVIHIEIESAESVAPLRRRIFDYWQTLRFRHKLPVLSIGLYLQVGLDGIGWDAYEEYFWDHRLVHFAYPYIGLPALDGEAYIAGDNILGVALASLMRLPADRRLELGKKAWSRLVQCPENEARRFLLCECVDTYLPVDEAQRQEFEHLLITADEPGVREMTMTLFEKHHLEGEKIGEKKGLKEGEKIGEKKGLKEGEKKTQREMLLRLLDKRFGPLSKKVQRTVAAYPDDKLTELFDAACSAESLKALKL